MKAPRPGGRLSGRSRSSSGDRVELRGFGAFSVRHRDAPTGGNPRTGEIVEVSHWVIPFFKTGKQLREALNGGLN